MTFDPVSTNNVIEENFGTDPLLDGLPKNPLSDLPKTSGGTESESSSDLNAGFNPELDKHLKPYATPESWNEIENNSSVGMDAGKDDSTVDSDRDPVTQQPFTQETSSLTEEAERDPITNPGTDSETDVDTTNETSATNENEDKNIESKSSEESEKQENDSGQFNEDVIEEGDREITAESEENHDNSDAEHESETSDLDSTDVVDSEADADEFSGESSDSTVNEQEDEISSDDAPTEAVSQSEDSVESDRETDEMAGETVSEFSAEGEGESDEGEETIAEDQGSETGDRVETEDTNNTNSSTEDNKPDPSTESGADDPVVEHQEASSNGGSDSSNEDTQAEVNDLTEANSTENDEEVNTGDSADNGEEETEAESTDSTENHAEEDVATEETGESESDPVVDPNIGESELNFDVGTFTVGESGEVGIDYLFDGGRYQGQVAIVSLSGMEAYEPGSVDFIQEAARRALSESELGHIAIDDLSQGAKFEGSLGERQWNQGDYQGVKTFAMRPGDKFFVMMVPNGAIERVANDPAIGGASRPLFSLATANPDDEYHVGQIADITGDGSAFAWEDLRVDAGTDRDYNDIIFQVRGAKGVAAHMDDVVDPQKDWRTTDMGQALIDYIQPYITPEQPTVNYDDLDEAIGELEDLFGASESETFEEDFETDLEDSNDRESGSEEVNDELETDETTENDFDEGIEEESVTSENSESEENVSNSSSEEGETVVATPTTEIADSQDSNEQDPETEDPDPLLPTRLSDDEPIGAENTDDLDDESSENSNSVEASQSEAVETVDESEPELDRSEELSDFTENQPAIERVEDEVDIPIAVTETSEAIEQSSDGNTTVDLENQEDKINTIETPTLSVELPAITPPPTIAPADLSNLESLEPIREVTVENRGSELRDRLDNLIEVLQQRSRDPDLTDTGSIETAIARLGVISQGLENPTEAIQERANTAISRLEEWAIQSAPEAIVSGRAIEPNFPLENQPLVGIIDTGFSRDHSDLDYSRITWGEDRVDGDDDPTLAAGEGNEHGTHILGILAATQNNGIGIDGINNTAPIWAGRAVGSGKWAESLVEFVDAARESGQPNAVVNLSLDLTQIDAEGNVTTRYEFTPMERAAIEYARQNNVMLVVAAGNDGGIMSVLGQSSQEFDNIITVGAAEQFDPETSAWKGADRTDYSSYGQGLDVMAYGGTMENPQLSLAGEGTSGMAGTSVATAKVTGAVSQVWAANPELNYRQVVDIIRDTATDLGATGNDAETGAGLLNLTAAVHLAKVTKPEEHSTPAILSPETWSGEGVFTPDERAVQNVMVPPEQRRWYYGWLNDNNPSDTFSFSIDEPTPLQFSLDFLGSAVLRKNGQVVLEGKPDGNNPLYAGSNGKLDPGSYVLTVDRGNHSKVDEYRLVMNFLEGSVGQEMPIVDYLPSPQPAQPPVEGIPITIPDAIKQLAENRAKNAITKAYEAQKGKLGNALEDIQVHWKAFDGKNVPAVQYFDGGYIIWNGVNAIPYFTGTGHKLPNIDLPETVAPIWQPTPKANRIDIPDGRHTYPNMRGSSEYWVDLGGNKNNISLAARNTPLAHPDLRTTVYRDLGGGRLRQVPLTEIDPGKNYTNYQDLPPGKYLIKVDVEQSKGNIPYEMVVNLDQAGDSGIKAWDINRESVNSQVAGQRIVVSDHVGLPTKDRDLYTFTTDDMATLLQFAVRSQNSDGSDADRQRPLDGDVRVRILDGYGKEIYRVDSKSQQPIFGTQWLEPNSKYYAEVTALNSTKTNYDLVLNFDKLKADGRYEFSKLQGEFDYEFSVSGTNRDLKTAVRGKNGQDMSNIYRPVLYRKVNGTEQIVPPNSTANGIFHYDTLPKGEYRMAAQPILVVNPDLLDQKYTFVHNLDQAGQDRSDARNLGQIGGKRVTVNDFVGKNRTDELDYYKFSTGSAPRLLQFSVRHPSGTDSLPLEGDVEFILYDKNGKELKKVNSKNRKSIYDTYELKANSEYYVRVKDRSGDGGNYHLVLNAEVKPTVKPAPKPDDGSKPESPPLLTQQGPQYFKDRPQFYGYSGNDYAKHGFGSSVNGTNAYREGNCTWYAFGRLKELGFNPHDVLTGIVDARQWGNVLRNGARFVSTPQPGDIARWSANRGHVAMVEKVEGDYIWISESQAFGDYDGNLPGSEIYPGAGTLHRIKKYHRNEFERFIRLKK